MLNYKITFVDTVGIIHTELVSSVNLTISCGNFNSVASGLSGNVIKLELITV